MSKANIRTIKKICTLRGLVFSKFFKIYKKVPHNRKLMWIAKFYVSSADLTQ